MEGIRRKSYNNKSKNRGGCRALCCTNCRTSTTEESCESSRFASVSSISHIMVQQRLDQLIKQSEEHNNHATRLMETRKNKQKKAVNFATDYSNSSNINNSSSSSSSSNKKSNHSNNNNKNSNNSGNRRMVMMLAMEKSSEDPREDFRRSMVEVILGNKIKETKDLRYLLKCYISMNSVEYRGIILEIFYQVCNDIFFCCKCH